MQTPRPNPMDGLEPDSEEPQTPFMSAFRSGQTSNPFATRHWGPGNVEFLFPEGESLGDLVAQLDASGWQAELVGDHGVGKSTLLATLRTEALGRGWAVAAWRLSDATPDLPAFWKWRWRRTRVVFLDSGERLTPAAWRSLTEWAKRRQRGLIVTLHVRQNWGLSLSIEPSGETFAALLSQILRQPVRRESAARWLANFHTPRQALFALYDAYEQHGAAIIADLIAPSTPPPKEPPPPP